MINKNNYFIKSKAVFTAVTDSELLKLMLKRKTFEYKGSTYELNFKNSKSVYYICNDTLFRASDHWSYPIENRLDVTYCGYIRSCYWSLRACCDNKSAIEVAYVDVAGPYEDCDFQDVNFAAGYVKFEDMIDIEEQEKILKLQKEHQELYFVPAPTKRQFESKIKEFTRVINETFKSVKTQTKYKMSKPEYFLEKGNDSYKVYIFYHSSQSNIYIFVDDKGITVRYIALDAYFDNVDEATKKIKELLL